MRITDWFLVIPFLPLGDRAGRGARTQSVWNIIFVIGITSWPSTARLVRAQVLTVKERLYVDRARALGAGRTARSSGRHVLPNVVAADPRQHHAGRADLDPHRDDAGVPRPRRPDAGVVGQDARRGVRRRRDQPRRVVVLPAGRPRHRRWSCWRSRCSAERSKRSSTHGCVNDERRDHRRTQRARAARPARHLPDRGRAGAGGARRRPDDRAGRDGRPGGRVGLRQVDHRQPPCCGCCRRARRSTGRCCSTARTSTR